MNLSPGLLVATAPTSPHHPTSQSSHRTRTAAAQPPLFPVGRGAGQAGRGERRVGGRLAQPVLRWLLAALLPLCVWAGSVAWTAAHAGEWVWSVGVQTPRAVVQVGQVPPAVVVSPHHHSPQYPQVVYPPSPVYSAYPVYTPRPVVSVYPSYPSFPVYQAPPQRHWDSGRAEGRRPNRHHHDRYPPRHERDRRDGGHRH